MKKIGIVLIGFFISGYIISCSKEETVLPPSSPIIVTPNANGKITYQGLFPLFSATCGTAACHQLVSPLILSNYSIAKSNGPKIVSEVVSKRMPKNSTLTADQIFAIKQWQADGFLEN